MTWHFYLRRTGGATKCSLPFTLHPDSSNLERQDAYLTDGGGGVYARGNLLACILEELPFDRSRSHWREIELWVICKEGCDCDGVGLIKPGERGKDGARSFIK